MMKIFWGFILVGITIIQIHANDYSIIEEGNRKGLIDSKGKIIIPPLYDDIGWSEGGSAVVEDVIGYKMGELWGLISTRNIKITTPDFIRLIPFDHHHLIASKLDSYKLNEIYGLVTLSGKTVLDFNYAHLRVGIGHLIASIKKNRTFYFGILDMKGNRLVPFEFKNIEAVTHHIYALTDFDDKVSLVNTQGKPLINFSINEIYSMNDRWLIYDQEGKLGILKNNGELLTIANYIKFKTIDNRTINALPQKIWHIYDYQNELKQTLDYERVEPIDESLYKAKRSVYSFIIDDAGNISFKIKDSDIDILNDSLATVRLNGKQGVINYSGEMIVGSQFDSIKIAGANLLLFQIKGLNKNWRIADLSGNFLSDEKYDRIHIIDDEYFAVSKNEFWGIVNKKGIEIIPPIYDTIYEVSNHLFLIGFHGEKGVVDANGEWKSLPRKGDLYLLEDDKYLISSYYGSSVISLNGQELHHSENYLIPIFNSFIEEDYRAKMGLLNSAFYRILPVEFDTVVALAEDSIFLFKNEKGWGSIDSKGNILFQDDTRFQDILGYNEGLIGVKIDGEYGFVDLYGRLRIANRYQGISLYNEGLANIKILGKWGCIDKKESIIIQPYYDEILPFVEGLAIARKDGKWGIIDNQGRIKISFDYDRIQRIQNGGFICILDNKSGLIDPNGFLKFYPKFDYLMDLQNNYVLVKRKDKYGLMTSDGIIKIPIIHDDMIHDPINNVMLVSENPQWEKIIISTE